MNPRSGADLGRTPGPGAGPDPASGATSGAVSWTARLLLAGLLVAVAAAMVLSARGPDPDARPTAEAVENRVMSTWCPGLTLAECPSRQATVLRQKIAAHVAEGWTNRRIDAWLVDSYGEAVLGRPRSVLAFLVPLIAVVAGVVVVAFVLRRRSAPPASRSAPNPVSSPLSDGDGRGGPAAVAPQAAPSGNDAVGSVSEVGHEQDRPELWRERLEADLRRFAGEVTE